MSAILLNGFAETGYIDTEQSIFCAGYVEGDKHIGIAVSATNPSLWAVYGEKKLSCARPMAPCTTFGMLKAFSQIAERLAPSGQLIVMVANEGWRSYLGNWSNGGRKLPNWDGVNGHQAQPFIELANRLGGQLTARYMSLNQFEGNQRIWEMRKVMKEALGA